MQIGRLIAVFSLILLTCGGTKVPVVDVCTVPDVTLRPIKNEEWESLGTFKLTAYCSCEKCCGKWASLRSDGRVYGASGVELKAGRSIAVDTSVIPYGTTVKINGTEYVAEDCGGCVKGKHIDIYFDNHEEAVEFALQYAEVFIRRKDDE